MLVLVILAAWTALGLGVALLLGGGISLADRQAPFTDQLPELPDELTVEDILATRQLTT